jgi:hypothetical protein
LSNNTKTDDALCEFLPRIKIENMTSDLNI